MCASGVSPARPVAAVGLYLRVSAVRRLRACTQNSPRLSCSDTSSSYNIPRKAMLFRPFGPGRRRFCRGKVWARGRVLATMGPGACDGRYIFHYPQSAGRQRSTLEWNEQSDKKGGLDKFAGLMLFCSGKSCLSLCGFLWKTWMAGVRCHQNGEICMWIFMQTICREQ